MILYTISYNIFVIKIFHKRLTWRWAIYLFLAPAVGTQSLETPNVQENLSIAKCGGNLPLKKTACVEKYMLEFKI